MTLPPAWARLFADLNELPSLGASRLRDVDAPCEAFEPTRGPWEDLPGFGACEGDGHPLCRECLCVSESALRRLRAEALAREDPRRDARTEAPPIGGGEERPPFEVRRRASEGLDAPALSWTFRILEDAESFVATWLGLPVEGLPSRRRPLGVPPEIASYDDLSPEDLDPPDPSVTGGWTIDANSEGSS